MSIMITGATGFIGCRLAEIAVERRIPVVALVRTWSHAARLARLPVRMVPGDILDLRSLREAVKGCDTVFHCAVDNGIGGRAHYRSSVHGTANVMQAALEARVDRVVHLSSVAVYSYRPGPDAASEDGRYRYSEDAYCNGKIDGEKVALRYARDRGLPVTILRPTIVYGPFGAWTMIPINSILKGRMVLVDGGRGVCNCLYIDNLADAMLLARERGAGEVFHVSDARPVSWREFIEAHARALGDSYLPLPDMSPQEIAAARRAIRARSSSVHQILRLLRDPRTRRALRSIPIVARWTRAAGAVGRALAPAHVRRLPGDGQPEDDHGPEDEVAQPRARSILSQDEVNIYSVNVTFSIEKARRKLGYDPRISFAEGMARTTAWIRWARLASAPSE